jgi:hypothetical protein
MDSGNPSSDDPRRRYQEFVDHYQQEPQGISKEEAAARYRQVAPQLSPTTTGYRRRRLSRACRPRSAHSSAGT